MLPRREFGTAICFAAVCGGGLHFWRGEREPALALRSTHETQPYFAGAGRVRVAGCALPIRRGGQSFVAAGHGRDSRTYLFGPRRPGDSGGAGDATGTAGASAGIFAGSGGALVADLVP